MRNPLRRVSALILGTAVAVALAACSSDDSDDAANVSGDAVFPVTVATKTGTVEIPEKPANIVALSSGAVESVLAVGETPVASLLSDAEAEKPFLTPYADDINRDTRLGTGASDLHIEKIASVSPDLIIAPAWPSYTDPAVADKLEAIAPTLFFDNNVNQSDWGTGFSQVAEAVGQSEAARTFLDGVDGERAQGAEKLADVKGRSYSFGTPYSGGVWLTSSARGVLADLGLEPADGDQKKLTEAADSGDSEGAMVALPDRECVAGVKPPR